MSAPTYKELIQLLNEAESVTSSHHSVLSTAEVLTMNFSHLYPHIKIGRPGRFLETVRRIKSPLNGRLKGSCQKSYLKRVWLPRIRNENIQSEESQSLPDELISNYGLTIELLCEAFGTRNDETTSHWSLHGVPSVEFYRKLHPYLKKWNTTRSLSKTSIGKFYLSIDKQLQDRGSSPYNTYRFIERVIGSDIPNSAVMSYGVDKTLGSLHAEIQSCNKQVQDLDVKVMAQQAEINDMKQEIVRTKTELIESQGALKDTVAEKKVLQKKQSCLEKKVCIANECYESTLSDLLSVEEELLAKLPEVDTSVQTFSPNRPMHHASNQLPDFQTKDGKNVYCEEVRELYYSLLSDQIPPAKVARTIKSVLKCFRPSLNTDDLKLPQERCAGYMRREELRTVSMAHKAYTVVESDSLNVNSDGTTKFQKKIGGVTVNGMVLCLNEVPDGTADSMVEEISLELSKLREIATALNLHNPERINWTLFVSSTSDSASTQKRFNRLVEQCREEDEETFGQASCEAVELVENLCAMHLGSNLRKAFLEGTKAVFMNETDDDSGTIRKRDPTDTFMHEFCKLFGTHGVPENGCGYTFADYLALILDENCQSEQLEYYQSCAKVVLDRQVGSRYFVSASNAAKIFYLRKAATEFIEYMGKVDGNNLERTLYRKLQDPEELSRLKADAIMFYFVYSELVMLAKSVTLGKSALDMNTHYLELQLFLRMVEEDPSSVMDKGYKVFMSEERLYGADPAINHRIRKKSVVIYSQLFQPDDWDSTLLFPLLAAGATKMKEKLSNYARNQLPGGKYWEPDSGTKAVLENLKPNNDICESILGFNDYLTTAIPNMHQMTRSTLMEVKKNGTLKWFQKLPHEQKHAVANLALKNRGTVIKQYREEERARCIQRVTRMKQSHEKRRALQAKATKERQMLSKQHLITTPTELREALEKIDAGDASNSKKKKEKLALIRMQINIRKKVLNQKLNIPFTQHGKQRTQAVIIKEFSEFVGAHKQTDPHVPPTNTQPDISDPVSLVGKEILHKFCLESGEHDWFYGVVISYNAATKTHELVYEGETEHYHFDLTEDIMQGDIKIMDD